MTDLLVYLSKLKTMPSDVVEVIVWHKTDDIRPENRSNCLGIMGNNSESYFVQPCFYVVDDNEWWEMVAEFEAKLMEQHPTYWTYEIQGPQDIES